MEAFYTFNERFAKIRSKRIEKAVKGITGSKSSAATGETPQQSSRKGKKRKVIPHQDEGNLLEVDSAGVDGAATTTKPRKKNSRRVSEESIGVDGNDNSRVESHGRGRQRGRGRGRGRGSGRGKKKAEIATSYDDASSSENDEQMEFQTSEEAPQLRRSGRPRKTVTYNAFDELDNPDKEDAPFMEEEGVMSKEDQEIGDVDKIIHDHLNEGGDLELEDTELARVMDEFEVQLGGPSDHGQEPMDYLQFGGGFCVEEDEDDGSNVHKSSPTREAADPMLEENQESNLPRPSDEDLGMPDNELDMNDGASGSDSEGGPENDDTISFRAMPNLRKKKRS